MARHSSDSECVRVEYLQPDIFVLHDFLETSRCEALIRETERMGYSLATINDAVQPTRAPEVRNNDRVMVDDPRLAAFLWERARDSVPESCGDCRAVGLNERFRFYRYRPGQRFRWHFDGPFVRDAHEESQFTFMVYLNEGFAGGDTEFEQLTVTPRTGMALCFWHPTLHQGAAVTHGTKYVMRTDVMYRR